MDLKAITDSVRAKLGGTGAYYITEYIIGIIVDEVERELIKESRIYIEQMKDAAKNGA
jgi:hypothetical protein